MISGMCHLKEIEQYNDLWFVSSCSLDGQGEGKKSALEINSINNVCFYVGNFSSKLPAPHKALDCYS